ncbi:hypothetical protein CORC01_04029 [Colletotrichum orchidophilum]|uniref:F-box domain-containing protein n=1 Tax=Colletotrichum orchidophilum TaxID=1209926 RepID=A0A1G4BGZ5_9PEZI|nr:uncharacterized protein CORC01_04029 [Colletotrichum orchidophilum]OHF00712.1 hypothetical protein CORC01_04029 [Colletotrichum orchidophilum]
MAAMSIDSLPNEILLLIVGNLENIVPRSPGDIKELEYKRASSDNVGQYRPLVPFSHHRIRKDPGRRNDILNMARVNRRFSDICAEVLYQRIVVFEDRWCTKSRSLRNTLAGSGAKLQQKVTHLLVDYSDHFQHGEWSMMNPLNLSGLRTLELAGHENSVKRIPSQPLAHWFRIIPKLSGLERLGFWGFYNFLHDFQAAKMPVLPRITDLCLHDCDLAVGRLNPREDSAVACDFFGRFPALRSLAITETGPGWLRVDSAMAYPLQASELRAVKHLKVPSLLELMCGGVDGEFEKTVETIELIDPDFDLGHAPRVLRGGVLHGPVSYSWRPVRIIRELLKFLVGQCRDVYQRVRVLDIRSINEVVLRFRYRMTEEKDDIRGVVARFAKIFEEELGVVLLHSLS